MRILEQEGFWVSAFKGALRIVPGPQSGLCPTTFYAFDASNPRASAGHVWLSAPPFHIIDVTIKLQPYMDDISAQIPDYVLVDSADHFPIAIDDVADPSIVRSLSSGGWRGDAAFDAVDKNLPLIRQLFPGLSVGHEMTVLKYAPTAVTASDGSLQTNRAMKFSGGRFGWEVYQQTIRPMLQQLRP